MPDDQKIPLLELGGKLTEEPQKADPVSVRLYNEISPSIVRIETNTKTGSGFAIGKPGEIVTNFHVLVGDPEVFVITKDGERHKARVKSADDIKDLAVLEIEGSIPSTLKPLSTSTAVLQENEVVRALGHPDGVTTAILSPGNWLENTSNFKRFNKALMADFASLKLDPKDKELFLQNELLHARVHMRPGNSGGPCIDKAGRVLGVSVYENVERTDGYFVPSADLKAFLESDKPKFKFEYEWQHAPDSLAAQFLTSYNQRPALLSSLVGLGGWGAYRAYSGVGRFSGGLSGATAAYGGLGLLFDDLPALQHANNQRDFYKAGLHTLGDSALLAGGLARNWGIASRLSPAGVATVDLLAAGSGNLAAQASVQVAERYLTRAGKAGLVLIAAGITAKLASDLIPDRLVNTKTLRTDGTSRRPFYLGYKD
ncbi:MAG: serine protease [Candidatus Obscuribacterales bacterium]|nr:serine protease [Candidatus Obscuribacterales bacterium]